MGEDRYYLVEFLSGSQLVKELVVAHNYAHALELIGEMHGLGFVSSVRIEYVCNASGVIRKDSEIAEDIPF